jgi:hypothetical protein
VTVEEELDKLSAKAVSRGREKRKTRTGVREKRKKQLEARQWAPAGAAHLMF